MDDGNWDGDGEDVQDSSHEVPRLRRTANFWLENEILVTRQDHDRSG